MVVLLLAGARDVYLHSVLLLGLPSSLFLCCSLSEPVCIFVISLRTTYTAHLFRPDVITLIISHEYTS
jgi:hypothetical protein